MASRNYTRTPGGLIVDERDWWLLQRNIECGESTLIIGPTGSGKTRVAVEVAEFLGRTPEVFHFGGLFDPEPAFLGTTVLRNGETRFLRSRFAEAVETPGRVVILDEINRATGQVANATLSLLDWQRCAALDISDDEQRTIHLAEGNAVIATANVGSAYLHTEPLDMALVNRMFVVRVGFPEDERAILLDRGLAPSIANRVIRATNAIREEHEKNLLDATVSTRSLEKIAQLLNEKCAFEDAFVYTVGVLDPEGVVKLRTIVREA